MKRLLIGIVVATLCAASSYMALTYAAERGTDPASYPSQQNNLQQEKNRVDVELSDINGHKVHAQFDKRDLELLNIQPGSALTFINSTSPKP